MEPPLQSFLGSGRLAGTWTCVFDLRLTPDGLPRLYRYIVDLLLKKDWDVMVVGCSGCRMFWLSDVLAVGNGRPTHIRCLLLLAMEILRIIRCMWIVNQYLRSQVFPVATSMAGCGRPATGGSHASMDCCAAWEDGVLIC